MKRTQILSLFLMLFLASSCEKAILDESKAEKTETISSTSSSLPKGNVLLSIEQLEQVPFRMVTKGVADELPTHLCFAIYDMSGTRIKQVKQTLSNTDLGVADLGIMADFGHASFSLEKGTYQLVALAHSSTKNPTMTNLSKIQFTNALGYSDTFLYYTVLTVSDAPLSIHLTLDRICALCRFVISDPIPDGVSQIKFQYKGGSGHFSAFTGLGVTNSTQVVTRQVQPGQQHQVFDLYTFLHQEEGVIDLTATALDAAGKELCTWEFSIPMAQNQITWLTGNFFGNSYPDQWRVIPNIHLDKYWGNEMFYYY